MTLRRIDVPHLCPKLGRLIIVDTSKTRKCLSCGFAVHKLVIKSHPYLKYALASNLFPIFLVVILTFLTDLHSFHVLAISLPYHGISLFAGRWLISENSNQWYQAQHQQIRNWQHRV